MWLRFYILTTSNETHLSGDRITQSRLVRFSLLLRLPRYSIVSTASSSTPSVNNLATTTAVLLFDPQDVHHDELHCTDHVHINTSTGIVSGCSRDNGSPAHLPQLPQHSSTHSIPGYSQFGPMDHDGP